VARGLRGLLLFVALLLGAAGAPARATTIDIVGPEEVVFDDATMSCFHADGPDGPVRAFRDYLGRVQMWIPGSDTRMIGPDLNNLAHDCSVVLPDLRLANPADWADADWLGGQHTVDGQTVHALIHVEYHGITHPGWCGGAHLECLYNSITYAVSTNGGESFVRPPVPQNLVAAVPYRYVPGDGRYGYFAPSNIIERNGFYYAMILVSNPYGEQQQGVCLMRTQTLADPQSWRAWDGHGFNVRFLDPYRESPEPIRRHICQPVANKQIVGIERSLTYNTYLNEYVVTGTSNRYEPSFGRVVFGFSFSTSSDLIHWSDRKLITEIVSPQTYVCGGRFPVAYPALLDPDSTDRNFATTDRQAYMYYTEGVRVNCQATQKRNLIRVPVEFNP
jgi:hypothetical protein